MNLLKKCGPQIRLCLFTFHPIASTQLNSLTTIDTLSWLGGAKITHPLWVQEVPGSIPGSNKGFYVWLLVMAHCPSSIVCASVRASVNNFLKQHLLWNHLLDFVHTSLIPGWSLIKVDRTVPVGCISRSRGQKIGFQNAIFKNLLVRDYKAQCFHIIYHIMVYSII